MISSVTRVAPTTTSTHFGVQVRIIVCYLGGAVCRDMNLPLNVEL